MKMKKTIIILFIGIGHLLTHSCSSDSNNDNYDCPSEIFQGDLIFESQEEVNSFNTECYAVINGSLILNGAINNISSLQNITTINGRLSIYYTVLNDLTGLQNVSSV